jgi:predicted dinucleotide-binding enzyme
MSEIRNVAIIGAGTMGHSLAQVFAENLAELSPGPGGREILFPRSGSEARKPAHR